MSLQSKLADAEDAVSALEAEQRVREQKLLQAQGDLERAREEAETQSEAVHRVCVHLVEEAAWMSGEVSSATDLLLQELSALHNDLSWKTAECDDVRSTMLARESELSRSMEEMRMRLEDELTGRAADLQEAHIQLAMLQETVKEKEAERKELEQQVQESHTAVVKMYADTDMQLKALGSSSCGDVSSNSRLAALQVKHCGMRRG
eukprot:80646-Hanusia_phi.AAC.1